LTILVSARATPSFSGGENRPEWIAAFWACLLRGIVVVPIDYRRRRIFFSRQPHRLDELILVGQEVSLPKESPNAADLELHELDG